MEAQDLVAKVLKISASIRVVTVCDSNGKLIFHGRRKAVKNILSPSESKESLRASARNMKSRKKLARKLGKVRYALVEYDKIKRLVMPVGGSHYLFVTCSTSFDHNKIVRKVRSFKN